MKRDAGLYNRFMLLIVLVPICLLFCLSTLSAQESRANPLRAVVSSQLEEPYTIYADGGFENGDHDIRTISPYDDTPPLQPQLERTDESVHSGNWSYKIVNNSDDTTEFSVRINPDKAEDIVFSCWIKSPSAALHLRPFMVFESNRLVSGPHYGENYDIDSGWNLVSFTTSTTSGFRYAHAGIQVPPNSTLYIDDVSVTVPVWKEPDEGDITIGGVNVPARPVAPVNICFSIHIEDPQNLISDEGFFWRKSIVFEELARLFHQHGGFLNIQPELEWALAAEKYAPDMLTELADQYNVTFSTHTHGPVCKGADGTPYGSAYCKAHHHHPSDHDTNLDENDLVNYVQIRRQKLEALSHISVRDHNGNFDMVHKDLLSTAGVQTLSVFKSKYTQKSYDALYTNPWRPSNANALEDISLFLTHDPTQPLIYIPGVGSNITKRHERVPLKVRRFAGQFIKYADKERVNAMNLVLHVDAFISDDPAGDSDYIVVSGSGDPGFTYSDEFVTHLQYWDEMLTDTIDPLVEAGYLQWASHKEIADAFIQWESGQQVSGDSLFTFVPSIAAGTRGIAVEIRLPQQGRFSGAAPVVVYVPGGFDGRGIPFAGPGLSEQGFIEISFNFPGSGLPGMQSGGIYDMRGPRSIEALRDVVRFALGETGDVDNNTLSDLCGSIQPQLNNVGLCGFSNGGNATLTVAGRYGSELSDLAWIVNWESPVGDGMPTAEAGDKGHERKGNPYTNPAYDSDRGEWDMDCLQYDAAIDVNKHHTSSVQEPLIGGFYFDINGNGIVDSSVDFVLSPISMERNGDIRVYYSERVTRYAEAHGLLPAGAPEHLTGAEACEQFWRLRNGENWLDEIGTHLSHLKFIVVASDSDHVQTAPDHPHIMIQHNGLVNNGIAFSRVNADLGYVADILGTTPASGVDNPANQLYDHQTIRDAVQPAGIAGLHLRTAVTAACCELADRTHYDLLSPQLDGVITDLTRIESDRHVPEDFSIQCYPNPFNPETVISWSVASPGAVRIVVYNQLGQKIRTLVDAENIQPGTYTTRWNGTNAFGQSVAAGVYFYQLQSDDLLITKKAILLR
jgi:hypothetical protein